MFHREGEGGYTGWENNFRIFAIFQSQFSSTHVYLYGNYLHDLILYRGDGGEYRRTREIIDISYFSFQRNRCFNNRKSLDDGKYYACAVDF